MSHPFKFRYPKSLEQLIFLCVIGLQLIKTMILPNPIDIVVLIGLVIVFLGWCGIELQ